MKEERKRQKQQESNFEEEYFEDHGGGGIPPVCVCVSKHFPTSLSLDGDFFFFQFWMCEVGTSDAEIIPDMSQRQM